MLTTEKLQGYVQIATILVSLGHSVAPKLKDLLGLFHADPLTDEQINAIERLVQLDAERRLLERQAMGQPG